ncbi:MAG: hypothetical protein PHU62_04805 [Bacteroidales bacterium]|jgi:hypothetical protein|nr:hypothetical protein [Bacteroidales bacterium]MDD2204786.1 hypothetical protein [Bacteroidales bacterium]MDD3151936.1 hypothetical protein [Bacteroidales bacterium]MDD3914031.1 hypothetical protein [Bacteroidales bacterium]MDD4633881.1 hypothetical protein [Bacteroidales bacterium]
MKKIFVLLVCSLSMLISAFAEDYPKAHFGKFGIQHFEKVKLYRDAYLGQTVVYLPETQGAGYYDKNYFKGKYNVPYTIKKIKGYDLCMTFVLQEVETRKKVKMIVKNEADYTSYQPIALYQKTTFYIDDKSSIPLLLKDKFDEVKRASVGTVFNGIYEITDMIMAESYDESNKYPVPFFEITNKEDGTIYQFPIDKAKEYCNALGTVYTHNLVKATYKVIDVTTAWNYWHVGTYYKVKNSVTGKTKDVPAKSSQEDCFKDDLAGAYISILSTVEKPLNPSEQYGETKIIEKQEDDITRYIYSDENINITIYALSTKFQYRLENISDNSIKVIFNDAAFVNFNGNTSKITHIGTKYIDIEKYQLPITIIKGAKIDDVAVPISNVSYDDDKKEWIIDTIYQTYPIISDIVHLGQIKLMLPIQIKDIVNEYVFVFDVKYIFEHPERIKSEYL